MADGPAFEVGPEFLKELQAAIVAAAVQRYMQRQRRELSPGFTGHKREYRTGSKSRRRS